jgi:hypothetical protein
MPFGPLASSYLNAEASEKLQVRGWLISAIMAKINHLRGMIRDGRFRLAQDDSVFTMTLPAG